MKLAKSIKYSGIAVEALECNETSYKDLGLTCIFCNNPVFWVSGFERVAHKRKIVKKEKTQTIEVPKADVEPFFSHFPDANSETVFECEAKAKRVGKHSGCTEKAISLGKQQRFTLFEKNIAQILDLSPRAKNLNFHYELCKQHFLSSCAASEPTNFRLLKFEKFQTYLVQQTRKHAEFITSKLTDPNQLLYHFYCLRVPSPPDRSWLDFLNLEPSPDGAIESLEYSLHAEAAVEAFQYLISAGRSTLLKKLLVVAAVQCSMLTGFLLEIRKFQNEARQGFRVNLDVIEDVDRFSNEFEPFFATSFISGDPFDFFDDYDNLIEECDLDDYYAKLLRQIGNHFRFGYLCSEFSHKVDLFAAAQRQFQPRLLEAFHPPHPFRSLAATLITTPWKEGFERSSQKTFASVHAKTPKAFFFYNADKSDSPLFIKTEVKEPLEPGLQKILDNPKEKYNQLDLKLHLKHCEIEIHSRPIGTIILNLNIQHRKVEGTFAIAQDNSSVLRGAEEYITYANYEFYCWLESCPNSYKRVLKRWGRTRKIDLQYMETGSGFMVKEADKVFYSKSKRFKFVNLANLFALQLARVSMHKLANSREAPRLYCDSNQRGMNRQ